jgi:hypothetical protein
LSVDGTRLVDARASRGVPAPRDFASPARRRHDDVEKLFAEAQRIGHDERLEW